MKINTFVLLCVIFGLSACKPPTTEPETNQPGVFINAPSISMGVSRESCTSMEVQAGTQVTWTNNDTVTLHVRLKQLDENGNETDISDSEMGPGDAFSTQLPEIGTYHFYCSDEVYATIAVK